MIDISYQRSIDNKASRRLIASIAANFDWRLCAPLVVSRRLSGEFIVIDGQHRTMGHPLEVALMTKFEEIEAYHNAADRLEGLAAASERRKPVWTGR